MKSLSKLNLQLQTNASNRLRNLKPQDNSTVICEVLGWDIATGSFKGKAPDGSLRYFRFIGNASLPLGSHVSVVTAEGALVGWADTKAR